MTFDRVNICTQTDSPNNCCINGKLQGPGEKIDFSGNDDGGYIYRGEFKDDLQIGEGRFMSNYWTPVLGERQLYLLSDWIEFCLNPQTTLWQIMDPLRWNEYTFGAIQGGTFKNDTLNGEGFYLWDPTTDEYGISVGNFADNRLNGYGIDISDTSLDGIIAIREGFFVKDKIRGKGYFAWIDPKEDFYSSFEEC